MKLTKTIKRVENRMINIKRTQLSKTIQMILLGGVMTATTPMQISAQEKAEQKETIERVTITGSRIARISDISPTPITVLDAKTILDTGAINISDVLRELPALLSSTTNQTSSFGATGSSTLNLRGMGENRTLVLVDGKRHVAGEPGTFAVDINTIPVSFIERVEVITGGASAIYGADAVTGVVNFILKRSIEGLSVRSQISDAADNDFSRKILSFTGGSEFADGKGSVAFALEYAGQNKLQAKERKYTSNSYWIGNNPLDGDTSSLDANGDLVVNHDGIPDRIFHKDVRISISSPHGNVFLGNHRYIFDQNSKAHVANNGTPIGGPFCIDCEGADLSQFRSLQPKTDRYTFNTKFDYAINEDTTVYGSAKYNVTKALRTDQTSYFHPSFNVQAYLHSDNAYLDPEFSTLMQEQGVGVLDFIRSNEDFYDTSGTVNNRTQSFVLGIEGMVGDDWEYDAYATYGKTSRKNNNNNVALIERALAATDAVKDDQGNIVCRSSIDPNTTISASSRNGCIPANMLGHGNISQESINWFTADLTSRDSIDQLVIAGSISHPAIFELPAGDIAFVAGAEYRTEESSSTPDKRISDGLTDFSSVTPQSGKYTVKEVFTELSIPLLSDFTAVNDLRLDLAARYSDYDSIGSTFTWKAGLDWLVNDDIRFRATSSVAVRAPNIDELYAVQSETLYFASDPCDKTIIIRADDPALRSNNCQALGLPADFESTENNLSRRSLTGGNPSLEVETSDSTTIGLVYTPSFINNFSLSIDYWTIEITDVIDTMAGTVILDRCVDSPSGINNEFCDLITRDKTSGEVVSLIATDQNLSLTKAKGIDFNLNHSFDTLGGTFSTTLAGTYLKDRSNFPFQNSPETEVIVHGQAGNAEWSGTLALNYQRDQLSVTWESRYIDSLRLVSFKSLTENPDSQDPLFTGSTIYHDLNLNYQMTEELKLTAGVNNLFDQDMPFMMMGAGRIPGSGLYDNIGRNYYAGVSYNF